MSQSDAKPGERMPVPMGVIAETGETRPELTEDSLQHFGLDTAAVLARNQRGKKLAVDFTVSDPMDLKQTGWGVVFASDADPAIQPAIQAALQPLLDWRQNQVNNDRLFKVFKGDAGVRPSQKAAAWVASKGVTLAAPVSPKKGVPFYLLLVGSPMQIGFDFNQLDLQWAVGRLYFDDIQGYADYAQKVVEYEKAAATAQTRHAAIWMPRNALDLSTPLLAGSIGTDFQGLLDPETGPLGKGAKFQLTASIGEGQATKARLTDIFRGTIDGGPPSVVFTGSHGAEWEIGNPAIQKERQGALVTQEWIKGKDLQPETYFAAADLPADAKVHGMMAFLFACFSGACPQNDSYFFNKKDGSKIVLTPEPFMTALPQALLRHGALAVIAHSDRTFSYGFEDVFGTPQPQLLRTPLELLMQGKRVGLACDCLNQQWSSLAAQLGTLMGGNHPGAPQPSTPLLANLFVARDDASNFMVLGDPATRLRTELMA